jgi:AcrR family transcriptional regulator
MPRRRGKAAVPASRDPERTRRCILAAALHEFAARGFAGARVDTIARRAGTNKRMLYHYFTDKAGLFRAVLHHKMVERMEIFSTQVPESKPEAVVPVWFTQNCKDVEWVRLLAWESLQATKDYVSNETERRELTRGAVEQVRDRQKAGHLRGDVPAEFLQLAKVSLAFFPLALPQLVRLITGRPPRDPKFQREYAKFLETIAAGFRPTGR